jgi:hypothetical protein
MDDNNNTISAADTIHIPLGLLALGLSFLFISQISSFNQASENVKAQQSNAEKQIAVLKDNFLKLGKAVEERKALVSQSEQTQKQFTDVMRELDVLAKGGDKDSLQVMTTFGIKVSEPAGTAPATPASGTPAPEPKSSNP